MWRSSISPRIVVSALKGGAGKTIFTLGLTAAWREMGHSIAPFKKGPDFIDAGWLSLAACNPCHNLDSFLMKEEEIFDSFLANSVDSSISIIEGNRGLFDGVDLEGRFSTAELAKLLAAPVILIIDVTMTTRTVAALIKGCQSFDPDLNLAGVILNKVAGARQENLIKNAVQTYCGTPVLGSLPKPKENLFPERHMGLVPYQERTQAKKAVEWAKETVRKNVNLDAIWKIAHSAGNLISATEQPRIQVTHKTRPWCTRIAFIRDKAFWFYYPENLKQLEDSGASLLELDAFSTDTVPDVDALYIGGGFPETQPKALADNTCFRNALCRQIEEGLPVYAECGGFMYLGESLTVEGRTYPMVGALPIHFIVGKKPQGHGYTVMEVEEFNPFFPIGSTLKGHEFHYSRPIIASNKDMRFTFKVRRGHGLDGKRDGVCRKNVLGTYTHVHATGSPLWIEGLVKAALGYRREARENLREEPKQELTWQKL